MTSFRSSILPRGLLPGILLVLGTSLAPALQAAQPDAASTATHPVTATPPLQVVPATPVSKNLQQRMRNCNAAADARKLPAAGRETFIKSCITPHRARSVSRSGSQPLSQPGSQPKPHP
jgi:hypothetical protein